MLNICCVGSILIVGQKHLGLRMVLVPDGILSFVERYLKTVESLWPNNQTVYINTFSQEVHALIRLSDGSHVDNIYPVGTCRANHGNPGSWL